jgi:hypothetical protein
MVILTNDFKSIVDNAFLSSDNLQDFDVNYFIRMYCDPSIKANILEGMYHMLLYAYPKDDPEGIIKIKHHLRTMIYPDFLHTVYWKSIAKYVKYKAGNKCSLCARSRCTLNVHHRDYNYKGIEILHLNELICLCEYCHTKFHNKNFQSNL